MKERVKIILDTMNLKITWKWFLLSLAVGIFTGIAAVVFQILLDFVLHLNWLAIIGINPGHAGGEKSLFHFKESKNFVPYLLIVVPVIGGLLSGFLVYRFAPEAEGHGTDTAIEAFHSEKPEIRTSVPFIKTVASAITIGTGGSGGREGPIALIGAGFGSIVAKILNLSEREKRILLASGLGAGIGAIFRAPIAGALFATEVLYSETELETEVLIPATLSSIISYTVVGISFGFGHLFTHTETLAFSHPIELGPYFILAVVVSIGAMFYARFFYFVHDKFKELKVSNYIKPAIGGFLTGLIGFILYEIFKNRDVLGVMGTGYGFLQKLFTLKSFADPSIILALFLIGIGKIITTSFSISSGGSGGVFGPSVVIGGSLGGLVGAIFEKISPGLIGAPASFVLVGMAGFFSAAANTPLSTLIMVSELTGNYKLLIPTMWVCTFSYLIARKYTIYKKQVPSRLFSNAHVSDFIIDILDRLKVKDVFKRSHNIILIHYKMHLDEILKIITETHQSYFPVIDDKGELYGIFTINDIRSLLYEKEVKDLLIAEDICETDLITVTPEEHLSSVLKKITRKNIAEVPVVSEKNRKKFLGMLSRREIITAYNEKIEELKRK